MHLILEVDVMAGVSIKVQHAILHLRLVKLHTDNPPCTNNAGDNSNPRRKGAGVSR